LFSDTATFGAGEANETVLEGGGVFVAKYARDGTLLWATSADNAIGHGIATDPRGNSYVTGFFTTPLTATFGAGEANETVLEGGGVFVAKYAQDGTLLWATSAGGARGQGIATDPRGNSYVTNETVLEHADRDRGFSSDEFVAKYARDGTLLWATSAGNARGDAIATEPRGQGLDRRRDRSRRSCR
jgi:secreted PhoX family phosphatase